MSVRILSVDVVVVVLPVPGSRVVRRVDVDAVDLALVDVGQRFENVEVLAVDHSVEGLVATSLQGVNNLEAGVDGLPEFTDDYQFLKSLLNLPPLGTHECCHSVGDLADHPGLPVGARELLGAATPTNRLAVEADVLRKVALEDEAKVLVGSK